MNITQEQAARARLHELMNMFIAMSDDEQKEFAKDFDEYINRVCTCGAKDHES